MDTKLIKTFGEDILQYRLRTARQKKRMQYEDFDKYLIQLHKEKKRLYLQRWQLGWELLNPPVQQGWKRYFVLREDVANGKHAALFTSILKKINTVHYSWKKDFTVKRRKFGRKIYVVRRQGLLEPDERHFNSFGFTEMEKQMFYAYFCMDSNGKSYLRYAFVEPWRFVLVVKPHIIYKVKKMDAAINKRIAEIDNYLKRNDYKKRQQKIIGGRYRYYHFVDKYIPNNDFKNKPVTRIIDMIKET